MAGTDKTKQLIRSIVLVAVGIAIGYWLLGGGLSSLLGGGGGGSGEGEGGGTGTTPEQVTPAPDAPEQTTPEPYSPDPSGSGNAGEGTGTEARSATSDDGKITVYEDRTYSSKDKVALYIHAFGHLPSNYLTKDEAEALGWTGGSLDKVAPGKSIGGDVFGNREGKLPKAKGRTWYECDIGTQGKSSRGEKRIVFSSDGLIYYTSDHYQTFTRLY